MASGLPCVASAIGGCRDVIANGETGLLVPPGDAPALQEGVVTLVQSSPMRARLGAAARKEAVARFSLERMVDQYEACYRAVLKAAPLAVAARRGSGERP